MMPDGKIYGSVRSCARAKGVKVASVYCALSRGNLATLGHGKGNRTANRGGRAARPVTVGPVTFPSMKALSRALGRDPSYVRQTLARGKELARANLLRDAMAYAAKLKQKKRTE